MSLVDDVKQRLDIVQLVSEATALDTRSRTPKALCPFHAEKTPSFVVFPESQTWRCFGACAAGGDALSFIMKRDGLEFREALRQAAQLAGIDMPDAASDGRRQRGGTGEESLAPLVAANQMALAYFQSALESPQGEAAREYLEKRGISIDVARRRGLGLCPRGLETLAGHLKAVGVSGSAAKGAGLVTQTRDGGWRDMFTGRLTIAIHDSDGRLAGFGARSLDGSEPKYLNTPRTELFDKSSILYGLHWAAPAIRSGKTAVVVEGYMDAIAAHENGFGNVVASMGTAVTAEQIASLSRARMAETVVLALDADAAGQEATLNHLEDAYGAALRSASPGRMDRFQSVWTVDIKVARLEPGTDPDDVIRSSPDEWRRALASATPLAEWLTDAYIEREDASTPEGRAAVASRMMPLIAAMPDLGRQEKALDRLGSKLGVTEEQLRAGLRESQRRRGRRRGRARPAGPPPVVAADFEGSPEGALEEHLLSMVLRYRDLREYAVDLPPAVFTQAAYRALFTAWVASDNIERLGESVEPDLAERAEHLRTRPLPPSDQHTRVADVLECVHRLRERHLRDLKAEEERVRTDIDAIALPEETRELIDRRALETNDRLRELFARRI